VVSESGAFRPTKEPHGLVPILLVFEVKDLSSTLSLAENKYNKIYLDEKKPH